MGKYKWIKTDDWTYKPTSTTPVKTYYYRDEYTKPKGEEGWVCPKCGRVNAPWIKTCPCYEEKNKITINYTTTSASTAVPSACAGCSNNPNNGGSGVCHCTLGTQTIY